MTREIDLNIAQRLKIARKVAGYTRRQVEAYIDIPASTVEKYERADMSPDINRLKQLIKLYGIEPMYVMYGT